MPELITFANFRSIYCSHTSVSLSREAFSSSSSMKWPIERVVVECNCVYWESGMDMLLDGVHWVVSFSLSSISVLQRLAF